MPEPMMNQQQNPQQDQGSSKQDDYDIFVSQGMLLAKVAAKKLKGNADPDSIASVMVGIVTRIETQGAQNGIKFDLDVMLHGSREILEVLLSQAGVKLDEEQIKKTIGLMIGKYLDQAVKTGKMSKEEVIQLAQQLQGQQGQGQGAPAQPMPQQPPGQKGPGLIQGRMQ